MSRIIEVGPLKRWRGLQHARTTTSSHGAHIIQTQARTLDEALEIISANRRRQPSRKTKKNYEKIEKELGLSTPPQKAPITLPTLKWMK